MRKPLYVSIDQALHSRCRTSNLKEFVEVACQNGRLDWIEFGTDKKSATWGFGVFEVDKSGRMTLVHSWWDDSD